MADFILSLMTESMPPALQRWGRTRLQERLTDALRRRAIIDKQHDAIDCYASSCRLVACVTGLPTTLKGSVEDKRGPSIDASQQAQEGFLRAYGVKGLKDKKNYRIIDGKQGKCLAVTINHPDRQVAIVLPDVIESVLLGFGWKQAMRWGWGAFAWPRPMYQLQAFFDGRALQGGMSLGSPDAAPSWQATPPPQDSHVTFLAADGGQTDAAMPKQAQAYLQALERDGIIICAAKRRHRLCEAIERMVKQKGFVFVADDDMLQDCADFCERPYPLLVPIGQDNMSVPEDVLVAVLRGQQKMLPLYDKTGAVVPLCLAVTDGKKGQAVMKGYERVLAVRLQDAAFFMARDKRSSLEDFITRKNGGLADIMYHRALGTMRDKAHRLAMLAKQLAESIDTVDDQQAQRAAWLAKADLATLMVGEFPQLQGVIGGIYSQESPTIATSIKEHYQPIGDKTPCPQSLLGCVVALADKIDHLVGFWLLGEIPQGSKDPYGLRRACLGIVRLCLQAGMQAIDSRHAAEQAQHLYQQQGFLLKSEQNLDNLDAYMIGRLRTLLMAEGIPPHHIDGVCDSQRAQHYPTAGRLVRLAEDARIMTQFLSRDEQDSRGILDIYRRVERILEQEHHDSQHAVDEARFEHEAEHTLFAALRVPHDSKNLRDDLEALYRFQAPLQAFFENVRVNCDDQALRANRLALLVLVKTLCLSVADFSRIIGKSRGRIGLGEEKVA